MDEPSIARPAANPNEVRNDPRVGIDVHVDVYSSDLSGSLPGRSRDLSVAGLCVATPSPFAFKSVHRVTLKLGEKILDLDAEGRWQTEVPGEDVVLTGIQFTRPQNEIVETLWDVVLGRAKQLTRFLHTGSDLSGFALEEVMGLAQVTRVRDVGVGATIYRQGVHAPGEDSVFIVVKGKVVLQTRVREAREVPFDTAGPGGLLGGLPITAGVAHAETAVADCDTRLLEIDRKAYQYLLAVKPWLALRLAQAVTRVQGMRIQQLLARLRDAL